MLEMQGKGGVNETFEMTLVTDFGECQFHVECPADCDIDTNDRKINNPSKNKNYWFLDIPGYLYERFQ